MKKSLYIFMAIVVISTMMLSACGPAKVGTEENPILWVFVPSREGEEVTSAAEGVADLLHEQTGLYFQTFVATDYTAAIEALCSDPPKAHMGSLATFALITAADRGCATPALVAARRGSLTYTGQIIAGADTGIASLADIKGQTFCATEPTSTSGWIIPSVMLRAAGLNLDTDLNVTYAGGHDAAVLGVYNGECQAGASFVDARTLIEADYPDVMEKVSVVEVSIDIPNDGVQFRQLIRCRNAEADRGCSFGDRRHRSWHRSFECRLSVDRPGSTRQRIL